jgi:hypothetical protein
MVRARPKDATKELLKVALERVMSPGKAEGLLLSLLVKIAKVSRRLKKSYTPANTT